MDNSDGQPKKILVAEDERPMAHALELKISKAGFDVRVAYDGEEAISMLEKEKFNLVLLDLMMPKKDGFSVLIEMREKGINVPVIVSTNLSQEEDIKKAKELGADDYFVKSNTPIIRVVEYIEKVLSRQ
jgi:two-component system, OmpR family, alkaline phosphatase synthesis response regulator PhoP